MDEPEPCRDLLQAYLDAEGTVDRLNPPGRRLQTGIPPMGPYDRVTMDSIAEWRAALAHRDAARHAYHECLRGHDGGRGA
jgi:hypothetical protein